MKRKLLSLLLVISVVVFGTIGVTACGKTEDSSTPTSSVTNSSAPTSSAPTSSVPNSSAPTSSVPQKLSAPTVTLSGSVASWQANVNADKFEISIDGNLSYVENTVTSKTLTNGQSFKIRAIGDGNSFTTSDWSNSVTYTAQASPSEPTKLGAPVVTISSTGLASWSAVANASGYAYKINGGAETPTTATSVQLTNGQSIVVKAVGDGTNYTDGDYSASVTYTASSSTETSAPTYLGITASTEIPTDGDAPSVLSLSSVGSYSTRVSFEQSLRDYLGDENNWLGDTAPTESSYEAYTTAGGTVYIQIWLNNPNQNTILSLKLNGVKYQAGGDLQSFFVQSGNSYLNCVYVAITVPNTAYGEISYEVTEIEYVEGSNVSQNGKAVLIDEDNDTVKIGVSYENSLPTATVSNQSITASSISFDINVSDQSNLVSTIGGWLRVLIYTQNNEILAQQKLSVGNNSVTFDNLSADTYYGMVAFVLGDIHDGNGIYVHGVASGAGKTESIIDCSVQSEILRNTSTDKYYPNIKVNATLSDNSFAFTRIEVIDAYDDETIYTSAFNGSINITENVLNDRQYRVKIYYENATNVEQSYEDYVYVERLDYPWINDCDLAYGLVDDAILGFDFGENKSNFDNLTIKIFSEDSAQYVAEDAIYLIDNPNAIQDLQTQLNGMDRSEDGYFELGLRIQRLERVQQTVESYYSSMTKQDWETELAKGAYVYELVYGQDDAFFKGAGDKYYAVLDGYQSKRVNDSSWQYIVTADFDMNDGQDIEEDRTIVEGYFNIEPATSENDYLFVASDEDYNELFTVDENNVLYLEVMSRDSEGNESYRNLGYVNQIVLAEGYEIKQVLWTQNEPNNDIDESAWLASIKQALLNGDDVDSVVFPLGNLEPITFDLDDIETDLVGYYDIRFTYKMYGKEYTQDHPFDWSGSTVTYTLVGKLPTPSVNIVTTPTDDYGRFEIEYPESIGYWDEYVYEIRDADEQLVGTYTQSDYHSRMLSANYSIRVMLKAVSHVEVYLDSDWSEWFVCTPATCDIPSNLSTNYNEYGVTVEWSSVAGAEKYVYVINDGEEQETYETGVSGLKNGDTFKVKALPLSGSEFIASEYSEVLTVVDDRTMLDTPIVTFDSEYHLLEWQAVDNVAYYNVYNAETGEIRYSQITETSCSIQIGSVYIVKAIPSDCENYAPSESQPIDTTIKLNAPEITISEMGEVEFSTYKVGGRVIYTYVINDGEEQTTNKSSGQITLNVGDTIKVKVSFTNYEDSDWSEKTYTATN
ncbi:MAG: hypothetical protein IJF75_01315 [Clostridia bacterium]|nr:hypothetical protein [Clostridia bacterium]